MVYGSRKPRIFRDALQCYSCGADKKMGVCSNPQCKSRKKKK